MTERMAGMDALLWHLESPGAPYHTLKIVILDPTRLGRAFTLDDLRQSFEPRLGLLPRFTQRVQAAPGFPGRPFWVDDPDFDLANHLEEAELPAPGDRPALDALFAQLSASALDLGRPLWRATLVHGLEGGRQAVVVRVHHAITDGGGALNAFLRVTADAPDAPVPSAPRVVGPTPSPRALQRQVLRETPGLLARLGPLVVDAFRSSLRARRFRREHPDLPPVSSPRIFVNAAAVHERVCASHDIDLAALKAVSRAAGVTINGVYHALIAAAMRDELLRRGDDTTEPTVAGFGIAVPNAPADRVHGNHVSVAYVNAYSNVDDPIERLLRTARSCTEGVEMRKTTGLELYGRWTESTCRLTAWFYRRYFARSPKVPNHVVTANVPGPAARRWAGPVEVVDWISFAVAESPSNLNITAYSYAGRLSIGLLMTSGVLPEPRRFLHRMEEELDVLHARLCTEGTEPMATTTASAPA